MSYKDLEEVRAKRIIKDATKEAKGKGKCNRKRKSTILEAEPEPNLKMVRTSKALVLSRALVIEILTVEDEIVLEPQ
jgi:hypothetical protein